MKTAEFKEMAKAHLKLKIEHKDSRVKISLMCDDECIDSDYIDYSEVVRVVDRYSSGAME